MWFDFCNLCPKKKNYCSFGLYLKVFCNTFLMHVPKKSLENLQTPVIFMDKKESFYEKMLEGNIVPQISAKISGQNFLRSKLKKPGILGDQICNFLYIKS